MSHQSQPQTTLQKPEKAAPSPHHISPAPGRALQQPLSHRQPGPGKRCAPGQFAERGLPAGGFSLDTVLQPPPAPVSACALCQPPGRARLAGGGGFSGFLPHSDCSPAVGSFWKNHPKLSLTLGFNALSRGVVFGKGARRRLGLISNVIVNRLQSLAGHPVAALSVSRALTLFSPGCLLLPDLHRGHKTRTATESRNWRHTPALTSPLGLFTFGFFLFLGNGESLL